MPSSNPLPPKENTQFKRILKCYEQKQYKNGLKFSKQILSNPKYQEHGETLAMKGLILNCLGRKEQAYDHVRRGLRNDLKSHVCWHVFGLLQRSDKKYDEAIKCYRNALKWDSDNIQILRDLSLLQIQMRDLEGYKDTRYQLFQLRPTQRASWIGFAMSYHLLKDYEMALKIIEEFRKTQQKSAYDYEHSELLLYQNLVIRESGDVTGSLEHLDKYQDQICDKITLLETKGKNLLQLKRYGEAESVYRDLTERNPENHSYFHHLIEAVRADTQDKKLAIFDEFKVKFHKAQVPQRLSLDVAEGDAFRKLVAAYMQKALRKGVPPLFVDLRPLYKDSSKVAIIEELCHSYQTSLESEGVFEHGGEKQPATAKLWLLYYMVQHYDHNKNYDKAIELIEKAVEHTPTLIELFLLKGKVLKHVGNLEESVACLDEAQSLDTADRYINCKCAKYLLRANRVKDAEEMCQKFTRDGVSAMENLNEMQCMWFQTECALAFKRLGRMGDSLKKCIEVDRHFTEVIEDQFDFHTYCMRKMTLRSYVDLLRLEDVLRTHKFYKIASHCAISVYLRLFDNPLKEDGNLDELNTENMDPSELKKLRNKQKKAKKKAELERQQLQQAQARKDLHKSQQKNKNEEEVDSTSKDELVAEKLERPEDPMSEAIKFLAPLQHLASGDLVTHLLAFEVYYRKLKPLLMLQSINRASKLDGSNARVHGCVTRLQIYMDEKRATLNEPVLKVLERGTQALFASKSARVRNDEFIQKNAKSLEHLLIGAKMLALLEPSNHEKAVTIVTQLDASLNGVTLELCSEIVDSLHCGVFGSQGKSAVAAYRTECSTFFKHSSIFRDPCLASSPSPTNNGKVVVSVDAPVSNNTTPSAAVETN